MDLVARAMVCYEVVKELELWAEVHGLRAGSEQRDLDLGPVCWL